MNSNVHGSTVYNCQDMEATYATKTRNQDMEAKYPLADGCIKTWGMRTYADTHTMECLLGHDNNEIMPLAATSTDGPRDYHSK